MGNQQENESLFRRLLLDSYVQKFVSFGLGLAIGAALAVGLEAVRYVPMAAAFGFLCFGFGIVLMEFVNLWRQRAEYARKSLADFEFWLKKREELDAERLKWEEEKELGDDD